MILYKPDCVFNYCELHAKHGKLHAHDHCSRFFLLRIMRKFTTAICNRKNIVFKTRKYN